MGRYLENGYILQLNNADYTILEIIGTGANSVVYLATKKNDGSKHIIKEYNPNSCNIVRDQYGVFLLKELNESEIEKFYAGMKHFCEGGYNQIRIRNEFEDAMNYVTNVNQIIEGINNTAYIDMTMFFGESYDKCIPEDNIRDLLTHIKAIAVAVNSCHKHGFLHLDIKPANIFVLKEVTDMVLLFDFDSMIRKGEVGKTDMFSFSLDWAAPEQINYKYHEKIGECTDIFAIGEILFYKIFGRHSNASERRPFSNYDYSKVELLIDINPKIKIILTDIFRKTLSTNTRRRYDSCEEMILELEKAIQLSGKTVKYINAAIPPVNARFKGREEEIEQIRELLNVNSIVAINGLGGMGKTELAKKYANRYREDYDNVIFVIGDHDWKSIVNNGLAHSIANFQYDNDESDVELFERVVATLQSVLTSNTLVIVDNASKLLFEESEKESRERVLNLPCQFLLTSRNTIEGISNIYIGQLKYQTLRSLFLEWAELSDNETDGVDELLDYLGYHTLTSELIAKQIRNDAMTAREKLEQIINKGLPRLPGRVSVMKDMTNFNMCVFEYLDDLFCTNQLTHDQRNLLEVACLLPIKGLPFKDYKKFVKIDSGEDISILVESGWIKKDKQIMSVHPMIAETLINKLGENEYKTNYLSNLYCEIKKETHFKNSNLQLASVLDACVDKLIRSGRDQSEDFLKLLCLTADTSMVLFHTYEVAKKYNNYVVCLYKLNSINNQEYLLEAYLTLAGISESQEEYEDAEIYLNEAKKIITQHSIKYKSKYLATIDMIYGSCYNDRKHFNEAEESLLKALEELDNKDYEILAEIYNTMGSLYNNIGDGKQSEKYYLLSLDAYEKTFGAESWQVGNVYTNLGIFYGWDERNEKAIEFLEKGMKIKKKIVNTDNHVSLLWNFACISTAQSALGEQKKALESISKAIDISVEYWGDRATTTGRLYAYKAVILLKNEFLEEADIYISTSLEILDELGMETEYASSLYKYARGAEETGNYEIAIDYYTRAIEPVEKACDEYNRYVIGDVYRRLGRCYKEKNNIEIAKHYLKKAYDSFCETIGKNHEYTQDVLGMLGEL